MLKGDIEMAKRWVRKSYQFIHSQEMLYMGILTEGKYLIEHFRYINYWYLRKLLSGGMSEQLQGCSRWDCLYTGSGQSGGAAL